MKHIIISLIFISISEISFAQSDFKKGYIITYENDTIIGFIDFQGNYKNLKTCRFKTNLEGDVVEYTPSEVKAFRYDIGNYFEAIPLSLNGNNEVLFIEKIIGGIVDAYFYKEQGNDHFLIGKEGDELQVLTNTTKVISRNGQKYIREKKEYLGVLSIIFNDSPETLIRLEHTDFSPNSIINISEFYHNQVCDDYDCIVYSKKKLHPVFKTGVYFGGTLSTIEFKKNRYIQKLNSQFLPSNDFLVGGFLNFSDPNLSERLSLQLEAMFHKAGYTKDSLQMDISFFKVPVMIKYSFPAKKIVPSVQLGVVFNHWFKYSDANIAPESQNKLVVQEGRNQYGIISALELSFPIYNSKELFLQGRYEFLRGRHSNTWETYLFGTDQDLFFSNIQCFSVVGGIKF